jgi:outer membrane scaffolding protein for murein synthesis (MipA/OmpV family)
VQGPTKPPSLASTSVKLIRAGLVLLGLAAGGARAVELPLWEAGAGIGVIDFPHYRGSNERKTWVLPAPYFVYRGKILQIDERRMRGLFFRSDRAELELSFNGTVPVKSSDNQARRGMPDLDGTLEIGPSLNIFLLHSDDGRKELDLRLPLRAVIATDFSRMRSAGWLFQPNLNLDVHDVLGYKGWNLGILGGPIFSDRRYNQRIYAVDPSFAAADRPAYSPGGGYAGAQLIAALSKRYPRFWIGSYVKLDTLSAAVFADSPLVREKQNFTAGIAVAWILGASRTTVNVEE